MISKNIADQMLAWYDMHARQLPWRISPSDLKNNIKPNPYYVWLSEIMLQQTTVATVKTYYQKFIAKWPTIHALASATQDQVLTAWAGLGYYSRARNLHKTAQMIVQEYGGFFPQDEKKLLSLAGIGRYSAASIAAIAFNIPAAVMDGNIERIIARLYRVNTPLPKAKNILYDFTKALTPQKRAGDYAQAMMDLGATICTPKKPKCLICPIQQQCDAYHVGDPEIYPFKTPKAKKPTHYGRIFLITTDHHKIMLEKCPDTGLFAGMEIFPYYNPHIHKSPITLEDMILKYKATIISQEHLGQIKHVFTHFTLYADIMMVQIKPLSNMPSTVRFIDMDAVHTAALPTLMHKALHQLTSSLTDSGNKILSNA